MLITKPYNTLTWSLTQGTAARMSELTDISETVCQAFIDVLMNQLQTNYNEHRRTTIRNFGRFEFQLKKPHKYKVLPITDPAIFNYPGGMPWVSDPLACYKFFPAKKLRARMNP